MKKYTPEQVAIDYAEANEIVGPCELLWVRASEADEEIEASYQLGFKKGGSFQSQALARLDADLSRKESKIESIMFELEAKDDAIAKLKDAIYTQWCWHAHPDNSEEAWEASSSKRALDSILGAPAKCPDLDRAENEGMP